MPEFSYRHFATELQKKYANFAARKKVSDGGSGK